MSPRATLNRKAAARVLIHIYPYMVYMYMYTLFTQNEEVISFVSIAVNTENGCTCINMYLIYLQQEYTCK